MGLVYHNVTPTNVDALFIIFISLNMYSQSVIKEIQFKTIQYRQELQQTGEVTYKKKGLEPVSAGNLNLCELFSCRGIVEKGT